MSERASMDRHVREMAESLLEDRAAALTDSGLRATVELKRWSDDGRDYSELRIVFWRGSDFVDVVEDLIVEGGRPVATADEFKLWLEQSVDSVIEENRAR